MNESVNILLVDDHPANLLALQAALSELRQNLVEAGSGEEALRRLEQDDFAVVLLDVQMHNLDGFETARRIRSHPRSRHTPIIFITAYESDRFPVHEAYALGAVDYLVKPLVPIILRAKVMGFVELFQKTEQIKRQAEHIRQVECREFERRLSEENARLRQSEQRFARFMQHLPGLAWIKDLQGRYVYANDAAQKAFHTPWEKLHGKTDEEIFPAATAAQFRQNDRKALASGTAVQVIETLEHEDGVLHYSIVSKFPILGPDGRPVLVGGMAIDVTDRMRAEQAQRAAQEQLHIVTDSMSVPVSRCGRDLTYRWVSKPYADWLGRSAEEIVGRPIVEVIGPDAFEALRPHFEQALTGQTVRYEEEIDFRGLGRRWINAVYTPTLDAAGTVDGWVAVVLDIDSRKRAEQALQEADRRKDEFLAMLAHELRNPLAPVRNALHILKQPGADASVREQAREMAERQVQHMARLLDDLLDVSRISRGRIELQKVPLDMTAVIRRTVEAIRPFLAQRQHELTVGLPAESVCVQADPTRVEQVLTNLLNNAAKYTDPGGHIWLTLQQAKGEAVVRVRDNGIGIAPDMMSRIFDPFVQAQRRLDRSQGGVGIGLTLVKRLVELHGGAVEVHSPGSGQGSEFVVRLPALAEVSIEQPGGTTPSTDGAASRPRRVLVVDDNPDAADSLALLLGLAGQEVRVAYDGTAALARAEEFQPELVFLDIGMPGMDGYEVARRLRSEPRLQQAVLVALTGWGQEEDRRRSAASGFDHHLVKPVEADVLHRVLADCMPAAH